MEHSPITAVPYDKPSALSPAKCLRLKEDIDLISNLASHSLKSPLNSILTYCSDPAALLSPMEETERLAIIRYETLRMREMVAALFDYLSIEIGSDKPSRPVNCNEVLEMVLGNLRSEIIRTHATINHSPLPVVIGREKYIASLFTHLIHNALIFASGHPPAITINATREGKMWKLSVQDNGIGISEEFHDIIFILFQRLHTVDKYPGLGVGLAMCKKIVECAGGRITVASEPGKGSTFFFTLPAAMGLL